MTVYIAPLYLGLLAPYYVLLTYRVVQCRKRLKVSLGDGTQQHLVEFVKVASQHPGNVLSSAQAADVYNSKYWPLLVAVRTHGNFSETVPLVMLLAAFAEYNSLLSAATLHGILCTFALGRVAHAEIGLRGEKHGQGIGRTMGMVSTLGAILVLGALNAYHGCVVAMQSRA